MSINSHTYVADDARAGGREFFPAYAGMMNRIGRERGWSPMTREQFDFLRSPRGALVVGSPQEVVEKILFQHELFGHDRFLAQISVGDLPHAQVMRAIELLGTEVAPGVRARAWQRRDGRAGAASGSPGARTQISRINLPHRLSPAARDAWRVLRSGPSLRPRLDVRAGGVWPLRALRHWSYRISGLPADCPILRIVTARVPQALRGFQQTAADIPAVSRLALLSLKSGALPIELTTLARIMSARAPAGLHLQSTHRGGVV